EDQPLVDGRQRAQPLDIGDQVPGRVGFQPGMWRGLAAAALVERHDVVKRRVEQPAMARRNRAARPAMQEDGGLGARRADTLPIDDMPVADVQVAAGIGFDLGIERPQVLVHSFSPWEGQFSVSWSGCWKEMIFSCWL